MITKLPLARVTTLNFGLVLALAGTILAAPKTPAYSIRIATELTPGTRDITCEIETPPRTRDIRLTLIVSKSLTSSHTLRITPARRKGRFWFLLPRPLRARDTVTAELLVKGISRAKAGPNLVLPLPRFLSPLHEGDDFIQGKVDPSFSEVRLELGSGESRILPVSNGIFTHKHPLIAGQVVQAQVIEKGQLGPPATMQVLRRSPLGRIFLHDSLMAGAKSIEIGLPKYDSAAKEVVIEAVVSRTITGYGNGGSLIEEVRRRHLLTEAERMAYRTTVALHRPVAEPDHIELLEFVDGQRMDSLIASPIPVEVEVADLPAGSEVVAGRVRSNAVTDARIRIHEKGDTPRVYEDVIVDVKNGEFAATLGAALKAGQQVLVEALVDRVEVGATSLAIHPNKDWNAERSALTVGALLSNSENEFSSSHPYIAYYNERTMWGASTKETRKGFGLTPRVWTAFFEGRLTQAKAAQVSNETIPEFIADQTIMPTGLLQSKQSFMAQGGFASPLISSDGEDSVWSVGPVVKVGLQTISGGTLIRGKELKTRKQDGSVETSYEDAETNSVFPFWTAGLRFSRYTFLKPDENGKRRPELGLYVDVGVGHWRYLRKYIREPRSTTTEPGDTTESFVTSACPLRLGAEGRIRLGGLPVEIGFDVVSGWGSDSGPNDARIFFSITREPAAWLKTIGGVLLPF